MTLPLTPKQRAELEEFHNRVDYDTRPLQHWQRVDLRPRIPVGWIVAVALGIALWSVFVFLACWLASRA